MHPVEPLGGCAVRQILKRELRVATGGRLAIEGEVGVRAAPDVTSAHGTIQGRRVPCLSADVQLLYHSGFSLEPGPRLDVELLRGELGASLPDIETA